MSRIEITLQFMDAINRRDADALARLMTDDHVFTDSLGNQVQGREKMKSGWQGYFAFCPDYWITHEAIFGDGDSVAVFGAAGARSLRTAYSRPKTNGARLPRGWPWWKAGW